MKWYEDKEYWLMCEGAVEIQAKWKRKDGDYFYHPAQKVLIESDTDYFVSIPNGVSMIYPGSGYYGNCNYRIDEIAEIMWWLPSQEDLQEMVKPNMASHQVPQDLVRIFNEWIQHHDHKWVHFYASILKLWLAFVMHELYQKKWNPGTKRWEEE